MPTQALNVALGGVAFAALARLQGEPARFRSYFLKGYSLIVSVTVPATIFCAVFADDIILVLLGPKWQEAAPIFRLLAPTILVFGIINPLGWLLQSIGLAGAQPEDRVRHRAARVHLLSHRHSLRPHRRRLRLLGGDVVVADPHVLWCVAGTPVAAIDLVRAAGRPFFASLIAIVVAMIGQTLAAGIPFPIVRLFLAVSVMATVYALALLFVMKQKGLYLDVLRGLKRAKDPGESDQNPLAFSRVP